jgi:hypothetical protein
MRILMKSGSTEQVLCHGHVTGVDTHVGPTELRVSGPVASQPERFFRAAAGKVYNRANRITTVSFSVTRECASAQAAEKFCFTHPRDALRENTAIFQAEDAGGGRDAMTLADAALTNVVCAQIGVSVIVQYEIAGGQLT